jgi:serine phosphatase RsbU (regulator of sigma subunit)
MNPLISKGATLHTLTEDARVRALHDLDILDTPTEERFDRVVRLAQRLFDVPAAAINLIDRDRQWAKATVGREPGHCRREDSVCSHTIAQPGPLVVEDLTSDPRFRDIPAVTSPDGLRFYAGHPLRAPGGERVGALCLLDDRPREISEPDLELLRDLAGLVERELAMSTELTQAAEVQRRLLPRVPPVVPGYEIAGRCLPAREVGGDFFDWYQLDDGTPQITIADVMGKGISAALVAASVRSMLRGGSLHNDLPDAVNKSSHGLEADLDEIGRFVTVFTARVDPPTGEVTYVDAGHGLSLILEVGGGHRRLVSDGLPLGALNADTWQAHTAQLAPGETLMTVSDGFLDFYDTEADAIAAAVRANAQTSTAQELVDRMAAFSARHVPTDDVTVVIVRRDPVR